MLAGLHGQRDAVDDLLAVATKRHIGELQNRPSRGLPLAQHLQRLVGVGVHVTSLAMTSSTVRSVSITNVVRLTGMSLPSRPRFTPNCVATVPSASDSSG